MSVKKVTPTQTSVSQSAKKEEVQAITPQINYATEERVSALEARINALIEVLNSNPSITSNCPKNSEGKRQISL